ncbi:MAG: ATP-binding protein [Candidatus Latescibacteria bacterium]|nr:ATP-binding protein [Candidatus Latescibacterota bacterium]
MTVAVFPPALLRQAHDRLWARLSPEQIQERIHNQLCQANLSLGYQRCTFDTLDPSQDPEAFQVCRAYAEQGQYQGRKGLILAGTPGNGKTSLAVAILRRTVEQTQGRYSVRFWNVPAGLAQLRQQIETPDPQADSILSLTHNRLLVLDDLGKQKMSEWVGEQFYLLLNTLCTQEKQVIITTNLALSRLFQRLDPALVSRLTKLCHPVALKGADRRL